MERSTFANIVGVITFLAMLAGTNIIINITGLRAFVTVMFSLAIAAYIADTIDPR